MKFLRFEKKIGFLTRIVRISIEMNIITFDKKSPEKKEALKNRNVEGLLPFKRSCLSEFCFV